MSDQGYDQDQNEGLARLAVRRATGFRQSHPDWDDALQVARIALWRFAPTWDEERAPWPVYGLIVAYRRVKQWETVRRRRGFTNTLDHPSLGDRRGPEPTVYGTRDLLDNDVVYMDDPAAIAEGKEAAELIQRTLANLSPRVRGILEAIMAGENLKQYGRDRGKCRAWCYSVVAKVKPELQQQLASVV
jgi:DNA-directed RNA polymerase specialized sigma24 family protein